MGIDAKGAKRITLDISNSTDIAKMTNHLGEKEVLINCYSKFRFLGVDEPAQGKVSPFNQRTLWLKLLDPVQMKAEKAAAKKKAEKEAMAKKKAEEEAAAKKKAEEEAAAKKKAKKEAA